MTYIIRVLGLFKNYLLYRRNEGRVTSNPLLLRPLIGDIYMSDNKSQIVSLTNVYMYYAYISKPGDNKFSPGTQQWKVTACISKSEAKAFKKLGINKTVKEYDTESFTKAFKTSPPAEFANSDDEYFTINFTQNTHIGQDITNKPSWLQPEAYLEDASGELQHVTDTINIGNGSKGDVRIKVREGQNGLNSQLHSVLVRELVEFEAASGEADEWASKAGVDLRAIRSEATPSPTRVHSAPQAEVDADLPF